MKQNMDNNNWHGTTIVLIRKGKDVVVAGDGQVSIGNTVIKKTIWINLLGKVIVS